MKAISFLYFFVALALLAGLVFLLRAGTGRDPRELMASADRLTTGPEPDPLAALSELDYALRVCRSDGDLDLDLIGQLLAKRGKLLHDLGLLAQARTDLETVLSDYDADNVSVEIELIGVHLDAGELDEARTRADDVLTRDPTQGEAWTLKSRALVGLADQLLDKCAELCRASLPDVRTKRAEELTYRASALEFDDPERAMVVHQLRSLFSAIEEPQSRDVLLVLDEATHLVGEAREALAESFRGPPLRDSLYDYMRLLHRSGRLDLTIAYAMAAVNHTAANSNTEFMRELMEALLEANRPHAAVEVVNRHFKRGVVPDVDFYETWCQALYEDQRWKPLVFVANNMRNAATNNRLRSLANFYVGTAYIHLGQFFEAPAPLRDFVARDAIEPKPGMRAQGWAELAQCYREQQNPAAEKAALRGALALEPEHLEGAAAAWRRLAELIMESEPQSFPEVGKALMNAIRLDPKGNADLIPVWREQGQQSLEATRAEIELIHDDLLAQGLFSPNGPVAPYELLRHAELHAAGKRPAGVIVCARRLLADYPGFPPALDLLIKAALDTNDVRSAAFGLLQRVEYGGPDALTMKRISQLPERMLSADDWLQLMQEAPERIGRVSLAKGLRKDGRDLEALGGLTLIDPANLSDATRVMIAELSIELGRNTLARERLSELTPDSPEFGHGLVLQAEMALAEHDIAGLDQLITDILSRERLDASALLEISDRLILGGQERRANRLLSELDRRPETRSGEVMLHLALQHWLNDEPTKSHLALVRSEAYVETGATELGYMIEAVTDRRWNEMPWLVANYESAASHLSALERAILDLLGERLPEAHLAIAEGLEAHPEEPLWSLLETALAVLEFKPVPKHFVADAGDETLYILAGHGGGERDPRQILVRILALFHPDWTAAVVADFSRTDLAEEGALWRTYLAARGDQILDRTTEADELVRGLLRRWRGFVPAWDLIETLETDSHERPNHPAVVLRQRQRFDALGPEPGHEAEDMLLEAFDLVDAEDFPGALDVVDRALELEPENVRTLMLEAQVERKLGAWGEAVQACGAAAAHTPPARDSWVVEDFVGILEQAITAAPELIDSGVLVDELDALQLRFPEDPLIPLAQARLDLVNPRLGPGVQLSKALDRLDDFRQRTGMVAIDSLRSGASRPWAEFFMARDPQRAHSFVLEQRRLRPDSLDLWRMVAETDEALGEPTQAIEVYEQIHRMLPDGAVARALARLYADSGEQQDRVEEFVQYTVKLDRVPPRDLGLQLIEARGLVNSTSPSSRDKGIEVLANLWSRRKRARDDAQLAEIGELYGLALTWRSRRTDRDLAHDVLTEVEPLIEDPARRNVMRGLANLALQMRGS